MLLPKPLSVATYVAVLLAGLVGVLLTIAGATIYGVHRNDLERNLQARMQIDIRHLEAALAPAVWNVDSLQVDSILDSTFKNPEVHAVVVRSDVLPRALIRKGNGLIRLAQPAALQVEGLIAEEREIVFNREPIGRVAVYFSTDILHDQLRAAALAIALGALLFGLIVVASLYALLWARVLRPLRLSNPMRWR